MPPASKAKGGSTLLGLDIDELAAESGSLQIDDDECATRADRTEPSHA